MALTFYLKIIQNSVRDPLFRAGALHETWDVLRNFLPARLVTPRARYVYCSYPGTGGAKGRWLPPQSLAFRPSAYALIFDEHERLLFVRAQAFKTRWGLPGGGLHKGETLVEGVQREVREETGLEIEVGPVVDAQDIFRILPPGQPTHVQLHYFLAHISGGQLKEKGNGFDSSEVRFLDLVSTAPHELQSPEYLLKLVKQARVVAQALGF